MYFLRTRAPWRAASTAARIALADVSERGVVAARDAVVQLAEHDRRGRWPHDGDQLLIRSIDVLEKTDAPQPIDCNTAHSVASLRRRLNDVSPVKRIVRRAVANEHMSGYKGTTPTQAARLLAAAAVSRMSNVHDVSHLHPLTLFAASGAPREELAVTVWAVATLRFSGDDGTGLRVSRLVGDALKLHASSAQPVPLPFNILQAFAWAVSTLGWRTTQAGRSAGVGQLAAQLAAATHALQRPPVAAMAVGAPEAVAYMNDVVTSLSTIASLGGVSEVRDLLKLISPAVAARVDDACATSCVLACAIARQALDSSLVPHLIHAKGSLAHQMAVLRYISRNSGPRNPLSFRTIEAESLERLVGMDLTGLSLGDVAMLLRYLGHRMAKSETRQRRLEELMMKVMDSVQLESLANVVPAEARAHGTHLHLPVVVASLAAMPVVDHAFIDTALRKLNLIDWALVRQSTRVLVDIMSFISSGRPHTDVQARMLAEKVVRVLTCREQLEPLQVEICIKGIARLKLDDEEELVETLLANRRTTGLSVSEVADILRVADTTHNRSIDIAVKNLDERTIGKASPECARSILASFARLMVHNAGVCEMLAARTLEEAEDVETRSVINLVYSIAKLSVSSDGIVADAARRATSGADDLSPTQFTKLIYSLANCKLRDQGLYDASADLVLRSNVLDTRIDADSLINMIWGAALAAYLTPKSKMLYTKTLRALDPEEVATLGITSIDRLYFAFSRFSDWKGDAAILALVQGIAMTLPRSPVLKDVPFRPSACTSIAHVWHTFRMPPSPQVKAALGGLASLSSLESPMVAKLCNSYAWLRVVPQHVFDQATTVVCNGRHSGSLSILLTAYQRSGLTPDDKLMRTAIDVVVSDPTALPISVCRMFVSCTFFEYYRKDPELFSRLAQRFVACLESNTVRLTPPDTLLVLRARTKAPSVFPGQLVSQLRHMQQRDKVKFQKQRDVSARP